MLLVSPARAPATPPLEVRGGLGAGAMLGHDQRAQGYGPAFLVEARPAWRLGGSLAAELALSSWFFPRTGGTGRATLAGAGLRFDPLLTGRLRLFVDAHAGLGLTGSNQRLMFDGGGGLEYGLNDVFALGLFGRYGQVVDSRPDAKFAAGGAFVTLAWPPEKAAQAPEAGPGTPAAPLRSPEPVPQPASADAGVGVSVDASPPLLDGGVG